MFQIPKGLYVVLNISIFNAITWVVKLTHIQYQCNFFIIAMSSIFKSSVKKFQIVFYRVLTNNIGASLRTNGKCEHLSSLMFNTSCESVIFLFQPYYIVFLHSWQIHLFVTCSLAQIIFHIYSYKSSCRFLLAVCPYCFSTF